MTTDVSTSQVTQRTRAVGLALRGVHKSFGARRVLDALDLTIAPGTFVAIVGRSGCGKSTLLRIAAGLETADSGSVSLDGGGSHRNEARVRIMFQEPRLLPWKSVVDNVRLGLDADDESSPSTRARDVLARVGLDDRADDWPAVLSGGQRQRVALARALAHRPGLLLLDEPLGALDALTRIEMQNLIESVWRTAGFTALLVTHDVEEAVLLADRVIVLEDGAIALDVAIDVPRPRRRGDPAVGRLEEVVLERVLGPRHAIATSVAGNAGSLAGG